MNYKILDRNIKIFGWLVGALIVATTFFFNRFQAEFELLTEDSPSYGLLAFCIPVVLLQFTNYLLIGRYRSELGVLNSYFKYKLLTSPGILLSIIIAIWTFVIL